MLPNGGLVHVVHARTELGLTDLPSPYPLGPLTLGGRRLAGTLHTVDRRSISVCISPRAPGVCVLVRAACGPTNMTFVPPCPRCRRSPPGAGRRALTWTLGASTSARGRRGLRQTSPAMHPKNPPNPHTTPRPNSRSSWSSSSPSGQRLLRLPIPMPAPNPTHFQPRHSPTPFIFTPTASLYPPAARSTCMVKSR